MSMPICSIFFSFFSCGKMLLTIVKKTMDQHVLSNLTFTIIFFINFDF